MFQRPADAPTGVGLGLRASFAAEVDAGRADGRVPFFEVSPENHMRRGGPGPARLARIAARFPVLTHGLSMSLGGPDRYDPEFFADLREFLAALPASFGPRWHSDHLCFCGVDGKALHDLLPLPFTGASARRVAARSSGLSLAGYFGSMFTTRPISCLPISRYAFTAAPCARIRLCDAIGAS